MGMKVRGGMFCLQCQKPVAAQKGTHRLRNTIATLSAPLTAGYSLAGLASGAWHCPDCGGPVATLKKVQDGQAKLEVEASRRAADQVERGNERESSSVNAPIKGQDQAFCSSCGLPIYAGDSWCSARHPLHRGWEERFAKDQGVEPKSRGAK